MKLRVARSNRWQLVMLVRSQNRKDQDMPEQLGELFTLGLFLATPLVIRPFTDLCGQPQHSTQPTQASDKPP